MILFHLFLSDTFTLKGSCIRAHVIRGKLNISTNISPREANSTDLRPSEAKLQVYLKRSDLCRFSTMFSMHMKCCLMHNMTTTLVTQCRSCAEVQQTSQQQLTASSCFVREGESAAEREFVLVLYGYNLLRLVKLILRDTMKSIISNCITNTIYCRVPVRQEII